MHSSSLSSNLANAFGAALLLLSLATTGRESQIALAAGAACYSFALGVLWARRPWLN